MTEPWYIIAASVPEGNLLRRFFENGPESVRFALEHPPEFRWAGFDMGTLDQARLVTDSCYEVKNGERKVIRLYQDGTLIFRADAGPDFLAWAQTPEEFAQSPRLNPVPVVESNASFVYLYAVILPFLVEKPTEVRVKVAFRNAKVAGKRLALTQYYTHGIANVFQPRLFKIHSPDAEATVEESPDELASKPDTAAYKVVKACYSMFDMDESMIPFVRTDGESKAIDIEALKRL